MLCRRESLERGAAKRDQLLQKTDSDSFKSLLTQFAGRHSLGFLQDRNDVDLNLNAFPIGRGDKRGSPVPSENASEL
jgi:hypothetical protein